MWQLPPVLAPSTCAPVPTWVDSASRSLDPAWMHLDAPVCSLALQKHCKLASSWHRRIRNQQRVLGPETPSSQFPQLSTPNPNLTNPIAVGCTPSLLDSGISEWITPGSDSSRPRHKRRKRRKRPKRPKRPQATLQATAHKRQPHHHTTCDRSSVRGYLGSLFVAAVPAARSPLGPIPRGLPALTQCLQGTRPLLRLPDRGGLVFWPARGEGEKCSKRRSVVGNTRDSSLLEFVRFGHRQLVGDRSRWASNAACLSTR